MKKSWKMRNYSLQRMADEGEGEGGGGSTPPGVDLSSPEVSAAIAAAVARETAGLAAKRDELLSETKQAKAAAAKFEGFDAEKYQTMMEAEQKAEQAEAERKGEWEKLRDQLIENQNSIVETKDQTIESLKTNLESFMVDSQLAQELSKAQGIPDLLMPILKSHVKVVEENGKYTTKVVTPGGEPRLGPGSEGLPMTIAELIAEFKASPTYSRAFEAENSGGGAGGASSGANSNAEGIMERMNNAAKAGDMKTYNKLREVLYQKSA